MRDSAGAVLVDTGTGDLVTLTRDAEIAEIVLCGGAGYGDPLQRSLAAVAKDLADGMISPESAMRDYGVVLDTNGTIDEAATQARRVAAE